MNKSLMQLLFLGVYIALFWLLVPGVSVYAKLNYIGVPAIENPYFADVRAVISGVLCFKDGIDPYVPGACLAYDANWAYPRAWFLLSALPISYSWVLYIGFFNILFFITWIVYIGKNLKNQSFVFLLVAVFSSAVLFCLERSNADLLILQLLVAAFFVKGRGDWGFSLSVCLILIAALLKVYPIVLLLLYIDDIKDKKKLAQLFLSVLLFIVYVIVCFTDFIVMKQLAPNYTGISFGIGVLPKFLLQTNQWVWLAGSFKWLWYLAALIVVVWVINEQLKKAFNLVEISNEKLWYLMGSIIYLFNYLIGFQVDYRLIFLLLCIPFLLQRLSILNSIIQLLLIFVILWANAITMWLNYTQGHIPISIGVYRPNINFTIIEEFAHVLLSLIIVCQLAKHFTPRLRLLYIHYFGRQTT